MPHIHGLFTDAQETDADLVTLCTPSGLHPYQAIEAAEAGKNILSEKPQGCSLEACDKAIEAADKAGVKYMVVKQNRFNPSIQLLRRAYEKGRFGKIYMVLANVLWTRPQDYYDMAKWRGTYELDGGCLSNQASHYVDLVQWFGGDVEDVKALYSTQKIKMEAEDTISVALKFKTGAIGSINATVLTYPEKPRRQPYDPRRQRHRKSRRLRLKPDRTLGIRRSGSDGRRSQKRRRSAEVSVWTRTSAVLQACAGCA